MHSTMEPFSIALSLKIPFLFCKQRVSGELILIGMEKLSENEWDRFNDYCGKWVFLRKCRNFLFGIPLNSSWHLNIKSFVDLIWLTHNYNDDTMVIRVTTWPTNPVIFLFFFVIKSILYLIYRYEIISGSDMKLSNTNKSYYELTNDNLKAK